MTSDAAILVMVWLVGFALAFAVSMLVTRGRYE